MLVLRSRLVFFVVFLLRLAVDDEDGGERKGRETEAGQKAHKQNHRDCHPGIYSPALRDPAQSKKLEIRWINLIRRP